MVPSPPRAEGSLSTWNDSRGFGFIAPASGGRDVFVHIREFPKGTGRPQIGEKLSYELTITPEGKHRAIRVELDQPPVLAKLRGRTPRSAKGRGSYLAIVGFIAIYLAVNYYWPVPLWVIGLYLATSAGCVILYAADKSAAVSGKWRIAESSLIALGFAGGWPGAIIAQRFLRHKTSKASFRSAFWTSVALNVLVFIALATPLFTAVIERGALLVIDIYGG